MHNTDTAGLIRPPAPAAPPQSPAPAPAPAPANTRLWSPWALALATALPLSVAYLIAQPPSGDLAAATYRGEVWARAGFTLWDNGWYGGHYLPGYSVLAPALGALAGERLLLCLSTIAAAGLFALIAQRMFNPPAARVAAVSFAAGACVTMFSGRVAFTLGLAIGLLAVLVLMTNSRSSGHTALAVTLALLSSLASPVAGAFVALAGVADALARMTGRAASAGTTGRAAAATGRGGPKPSASGKGGGGGGGGGGAGLLAGWRGLTLAAAALTPIALFSLAFPEGGYEPFAPSVFWPGLAGVAAIALALPRLGGQRPGVARALSIGAWLYALALIGSFALQTPVGSNAARLGELFAAPLVAGALWERTRPGDARAGRPARGWLRHRRVALLALAPVLLYWQLETPISDVSELVGDPSVNAAYYAPLLHELQRRANGEPLRVEVPQTGAHWESVYLPEHGSILLARGWERQLDTRYGALFYGRGPTAAAYRAWLYENAIAYVALPSARLDFSATAEGRLIALGLPYLREVWRSPHWRLFAVAGAPPLAQRPARMLAVGVDSFTLAAPRPGSFTVRVRYTPYWALRHGRGCVLRAPGGWTAVRARAAGTIEVGIDFALTRIFSDGARCA
ncbi:MAG TPA: hypothetical protein VNV42_01410 [Solirubrobacteraceae bacterium]|jgi:hypothetical protein|nr:hypothetical protein [Solirubrobacteraceae bacterium]